MTTGNPYRSDFARRHFAAGLAEGRAEGKAIALLAILEARGIEISDDSRAMIANTTDLDLLSEWIRRAAAAHTIEDVEAGFKTPR